MPNHAAAPTSVDTTKARLRRISRRTAGSGVDRSRHTKAASASALTANPPSTPIEVQPHASACRRAPLTPSSTRVPSTSAGASSDRRLPPVARGRIAHAASAATTAMGTCTQNIPGQPISDVSTPPTIGPTTAAVAPAAK